MAREKKEKYYRFIINGRKIVVSYKTAVRIVSRIPEAIFVNSFEA